MKECDSVEAAYRATSVIRKITPEADRAELLDRAVWRRMQLRLSLPHASRDGKVEWLKA